MTDLPRLHLVTDDRHLNQESGLVRILRAAAAGLPACHLRGPGLTARQLFERARALKPTLKEVHCRLFINDRLDVALATGADGVHLGARSLPLAQAKRILPPGMVIGVSIHQAEEAEQVEQEGGDYCMVGTIYPSASKPHTTPAGPELIRAVRQRTQLPLIAIGGITPERVGEVLRAGADGVAVISGILDQEDPGAAVRAYLKALEQSSKHP